MTRLRGAIVFATVAGILVAALQCHGRAPMDRDRSASAPRDQYQVMKRNQPIADRRTPAARRLALAPEPESPTREAEWARQIELMCDGRCSADAKDALMAYCAWDHDSIRDGAEDPRSGDEVDRILAQDGQPDSPDVLFALADLSSPDDQARAFEYTDRVAKGFTGPDRVDFVRRAMTWMSFNCTPFADSPRAKFARRNREN